MYADHGDGHAKRQDGHRHWLVEGDGYRGSYCDCSSGTGRQCKCTRSNHSPFIAELTIED